MKTSLNAAIMAMAIGLIPPVFAAGMDGMDMKPAGNSVKAPHPVPAEIRKIDTATGKITLKHGPIANLGMSAMTMAFPVKDPAMLGNLKEGNKVSATFDIVDGEATVIDLHK